MTNERLEEIKQIILNIYKTLKINEFPIDLRYILESYGIQVYTYSFFGRELCLKYSEDSFSFGSKIFYDEKMYHQRIRFSIAHELGHIMLNHTRLKENKYIEEEEADRFAACVLAPIAVIAKIDCVTIDGISSLFDISKYAAEVAYREYRRNRRGLMNMSKCDREMYKYISDNDTYAPYEQKINYASNTYHTDKTFDIAFNAYERAWLYGEDY